MGFLLFLWLEDKIAIQNKRERQSRPIGQGGLDVQASIDQPVTDHGEAVAGAGTDGLHQVVFVP